MNHWRAHEPFNKNMKKVLTTLTVICFGVPSAAFAGSLRSEFGSQSVRTNGVSSANTKAMVDNGVSRTSTFNFENSNSSINGSINSENFRFGSREGSGNYSDSSVGVIGVLGAEGGISGEGTYETLDNSQSASGSLQATGGAVVLGAGVNDENTFTQSSPNTEPYVDGSVSWSMGAQENTVTDGYVQETVNGRTMIDSRTLATDISNGYESDAYTTFSY